MHFYPRSHVGNDLLCNMIDEAYMKFLSTFPRRERLLTFSRGSRKMDFYPRSHVGNDWLSGLMTNRGRLFLSTFPRRERRRCRKGISVSMQFLSTFPRRERPPLSHISRRAEYYFYPRSHVGNDCLALRKECLSVSFLSTFPRRERLVWFGYIIYSAKFLSTFPRKGTTGLKPDETLKEDISIHVPT